MTFVILQICFLQYFIKDYWILTLKTINFVNTIFEALYNYEIIHLFPLLYYPFIL
jgi:hypothetical protein